MRKDMLICRCLEFFALQKIGMTIKGLSYSCNFSSMSYSCLTRVSMDPRNKSEDDCYKKNESEDDCSECMSEDDKRECESEDDCYKKMRPSMTRESVYSIMTLH